MLNRRRFFSAALVAVAAAAGYARRRVWGRATPATDARFVVTGLTEVLEPSPDAPEKAFFFVADAEKTLKPPYAWVTAQAPFRGSYYVRSVKGNNIECLLMRPLRDGDTPPKCYASRGGRWVTAEPLASVTLEGGAKSYVWGGIPA